jgi:hypothetical protein
LFVDISGLIAMQEGRDVLAAAFNRKDTPNQLQEARSIWSGGLANAQEGKETRQDRAAKLGDYCRFEPTKTSLTMWHMWEEGLIDLAAGDIVKVVTTPKDEMCHVNKPANAGANDHGISAKVAKGGAATSKVHCYYGAMITKRGALSW